MSFQWDSLRAHTGCLKLFDLNDLTAQVRRLQLRQEKQQEQQQQEQPDRPRAYHFQRLSPSMLFARRDAANAAAAAAAAAPSSSSSSSSTSIRPSVVTENEATVGADLAAASFFSRSSGSSSRSGTGSRLFPGRGRTLVGENGLVVFIEEEGAKVRVMRDRRRKEDLLQAFPSADPCLVEAVWEQAHEVFAAASTILTSLQNSGHHTREGWKDGGGDGGQGLRVEDPMVWPSVEEVWGEGGKETRKEGGGEEGWEHVALSTGGEQWVFLGEEKEEGEEGGGGEGGSEGGKEVMSYKAALVSSLMELAEGEEWPMAPVRRTLASLSSYGRKKKARTLQEEEAEEGREEEMEGVGGWMEEYELQKAVAVRTRRSVGRKRLTETGKRRMAAKLVSRAAPRGAGEDGEGDEGIDVW